ncbi:exosortase H-associated membrane protein [Allofranklinella schreckenbergeri]|uniref:exosortase H-associated membrane protein n=1 Tax=Allofranklinella schreckenbergeri TaxID=1076744 RepID=UPI001EEDF1EA|nr:exosortase H-associated membrane protein [Allofranklinella schreckenbergeri]
MSNSPTATVLFDKRQVRLPVFALTVFLWLAVLIPAWVYVKPWTSWPVSAIAAVALESGASGWVREAHTQPYPHHLEVNSRIDFPVPNSGGQRAELSLEADPARYAYGLPIFLALLLAARQKRLLLKALAGYALLLPFQAFTLVFFILQEIIVAAQLDLGHLRISAWQIEGIVYGFQLGTLIVPTLVPVLIWLWLDKQFFLTVVARTILPPGARRAR